MYLQEIADEFGSTLQAVTLAHDEWSRELQDATRATPSDFRIWLCQRWRRDEKPPAAEVVKVAPNSPPGRSLQQALQLLQQQPIGSASSMLIEAGVQVSFVERENALLKIENADLKLRLRAAGVEIP